MLEHLVEEVGREQAVVWHAVDVIGPVVRHDRIGDLDGTLDVSATQRILRKRRGLRHECLRYLTRKLDGQRPAKLVEVPLLADARALAGGHVVFLQPGVRGLVVGVVAHEVGPGTKDDVRTSGLHNYN